MVLTGVQQLDRGRGIEGGEGAGAMGKREQPRRLGEGARVSWVDEDERDTG